MYLNKKSTIIKRETLYTEIEYDRNTEKIIKAFQNIDAIFKINSIF